MATPTRRSDTLGFCALMLRANGRARVARLPRRQRRTGSIGMPDHTSEREDGPRLAQQPLYPQSTGADGLARGLSHHQRRYAKPCGTRPHERRRPTHDWSWNASRRGRQYRRMDCQCSAPETRKRDAILRSSGGASAARAGGVLGVAEVSS